MKIVGTEAWNVAVPFQNAIESAYGISYPARIRTIIRLTTDEGLTGIGESGPSAVHSIDRDALAPRFLREVAPKVEGRDPFLMEQIRADLGWSADAVAVEMACHDIIGKATGLPVAELLTGTRPSRRIPVAAYAFFRLPDADGLGAVTPDNFVSSVRKQVDEGGFETIKLKLGVHSPDIEVELTRAVREEFPKSDIRIDPNGAWSLATAVRALHRLRDLDLEFAEDPIKDSPLGISQEILTGRTIDVDGLSSLRQRSTVPICADNCYRLDLLRSVIRSKSADVVLADVFGCGGLRATVRWYEAAELFHLGLGMHSGTELGIGQAAKLHVVAAMDGRVDHATDAIYPEYVDDVLAGGKIPIVDGHMELPNGPGLGVELDDARLERWELTEQRHRELDERWEQLKVERGVRNRSSSLLVRQF